MADKSTTLVLSALTRAAADAAGLPLHGSKTTPGLFPTTTLGKQTAQRCCDEGYLQAVHGSGGNGKATPPICTLTEKGMAYLLGQVSPRQVLEDCVRILEEREGQLDQLLTGARQMQTSLESLRSTITNVLTRLSPPTGDLKALFAEFRQSPTDAVPPPAPQPDLTTGVLRCLERWASSGAAEDCPLPELYRRLDGAPSIGAFHDVLRRLQASGRIYLHPWTGPLYEIPEPACALLVGHEVAYYASLTSGGE